MLNDTACSGVNLAEDFLSCASVVTATRLVFCLLLLPVPSRFGFVAGKMGLSERANLALAVFTLRSGSDAGAPPHTAYPNFRQIEKSSSTHTPSLVKVIGPNRRMPLPALTDYKTLVLSGDALHEDRSSRVITVTGKGETARRAVATSAPDLFDTGRIRRAGHDSATTRPGLIQMRLPKVALNSPSH